MVENCVVMALAAVCVEIQDRSPAICHAWLVLDAPTGHSITQIQGLAARMANGARILDRMEAAARVPGAGCLPVFHVRACAACRLMCSEPGRCTSPASMWF